MASIYIHIPFCVAKCGYCAFNSYVGEEELYSRYVEALKKEISDLSRVGNKGLLNTLFFGGGTPTVLSAEQLIEIMNCCSDLFGIRKEAEISIEVNPKTVDFMKLLMLRQAGVNRISIGIQSFIDSELHLLGRLHDAQEGWDCVRDAIDAGFENISMDLMSGLPGQSAEAWRWNLESALSLCPSHLSLYQLTIEENTPFYHLLGDGMVALPDERVILEMDKITAQLCFESGLVQYEISNFSALGFECRHNINYWYNKDYLAVGAGAVSNYKGKRSRNQSDPLKYCELIESGQSPIEESEELDRDASFRESVVMGLRMTKGVQYSALRERYGVHLREYYGPILDPMIKEGLVEFTQTHFRLTKKGRPIANQIMAELV